MDDDVPVGSWSIAPDLREQMRLEGIRGALEGGRVDQAILEAEEMLDGAPDHPEVLYLLGESLLEAGDAELALHAFQSCARHLDGEPSVELLYRLGLASFEVCDLADALVHLREVVRREPDHADAHFTLGMVYEWRDAEGDAARALQAFEAARVLDPEVYPPPMELEPGTLVTALKEAISQLPAELATLLDGVPVTLVERPDLAELRKESPPLPPTVVALLDGDPGEDPDHAEPPSGLRVFIATLRRYPTFDDVVGAIRDGVAVEAADWLGLS
jgi:tetratricopeptide (TPR) repeat protein